MFLTNTGGQEMLSRLLVLSVGFGLLLGTSPTRGDDVKDVTKKLEGKWLVESVKIDGKDTFPPKDTEVVFADGKMTTTPAKGKERVWKFTIDPSKKPNEIDFEFADEVSKGVVPKGIFELDGDTLKLCTQPKRPTEFNDKGQRLWVLKRKK